MKKPTSMTRRDFFRALTVSAAAVALPGCDARMPFGPSGSDESLDRGSGVTVKDFSTAHGIVPPMITPFLNTPGKEIDWAVFDAVIEFHIARGVSGVFIVCGSGEMFELTEDEAVAMASRAVSVAAGRINILCGSSIHMNYSKDMYYGGDNNNIAAYEADRDANIAMTQRIGATGVAGCVINIPQVVPQSYAADIDNKMLDYFTAVHDGTSYPLFGYELPGNVHGYKYSSTVFAAMGAMPRYIGIKDTTCDVAKVQAKIDAAGGTIMVMDANTANLYRTLTIGATGGINTTANVAPNLYAKLYEYAMAGNFAKSMGLMSYINLIDGKLGYGYMRSVKVALGMMGVPITSACRLDKPDFGIAEIMNLSDMIKLIKEAEEMYDAKPVSVSGWREA
jgi:4-hydroxy-tetrahydrodipicolinate synthase